MSDATFQTVLAPTPLAKSIAAASPPTKQRYQSRDNNTNVDINTFLE
jgi:hypothetical protein